MRKLNEVESLYVSWVVLEFVYVNLSIYLYMWLIIHGAIIQMVQINNFSLEFPARQVNWFE